MAQVISNFYLVDYGSFFINLMLQASSFTVLLDLNRFVELVDSGFSASAAHLFRQGYRSLGYKHREAYSFKLGYNYAESAAVGVLVLFIG